MKVQPLKGDVTNKVLIKGMNITLLFAYFLH